MRKWIALLLAATVPVASLAAQDSLKFGPEGLDQAIAETAIRRTGVMVPMRDGVGLSTTVFTPKGAKGKLPTILLKTPYDEHPVRAGTLRQQGAGEERDEGEAEGLCVHRSVPFDPAR